VAEQALDLDLVLDRMQIIQVTFSVLIQARTLVRRHRSGIDCELLMQFM
jgi:hypothetical protein